MPITSINGGITVHVDAVAIEQTVLNYPKAVAAFPPALVAMVAALHSDDVQSFQRALDIKTHTLEYESATPCSEFQHDDWLVKFRIVQRKKLADE